MNKKLLLKKQPKKNKRIAIFFDCENVSYKHIDEISHHISSIGEVIINRAYHNWTNNQSQNWKKQLSKFNIKAINVSSSISGKNSVDMTIAVDVINTTNQNDIDIIALVSSDCDFMPVVMDIKKKGIMTIGFGEEKTDMSFRKYYDTFFQLKKIENKKIKLLREAIVRTKRNSSFAYISDVATYLKNAYSDLSPKSFGAKRWTDILKEEREYFIVASTNNRRTLLVKEK